MKDDYDIETSLNIFFLNFFVYVTTQLAIVYQWNECNETCRHLINAIHCSHQVTTIDNATAVSSSMFVYAHLRAINKPVATRPETPR